MGQQTVVPVAGAVPACLILATSFFFFQQFPLHVLGQFVVLLSELNGIQLHACEFASTA